MRYFKKVAHAFFKINLKYKIYKKYKNIKI